MLLLRYAARLLGAPRYRPGQAASRQLASRLLAAALILASATDAAAAQTVDGALDGAEKPTASENPAANPDIENRTARIGARLRCPVCRQQSVAESSSRIAREMQDVIREMLVQGRSEQEIEVYFVEAYGPWILLKPRAEGINLVVYLGPAAALLLGLLFLARRFRAVHRAAHVATSADSPADRQDPPEVAEIDRRQPSKRDRAWIESAIRGS